MRRPPTPVSTASTQFDLLFLEPERRGCSRVATIGPDSPPTSRSRRSRVALAAANYDVPRAVDISCAAAESAARTLAVIVRDGPRRRAEGALGACSIDAGRRRERSLPLLRHPRSRSASATLYAARAASLPARRRALVRPSRLGEPAPATFRAVVFPPRRVARFAPYSALVWRLLAGRVDGLLARPGVGFRGRTPSFAMSGFIPRPMRGRRPVAAASAIRIAHGIYTIISVEVRPQYAVAPPGRGASRFTASTLIDHTSTDLPRFGSGLPRDDLSSKSVRLHQNQVRREGSNLVRLTTESGSVLRLTLFFDATSEDPSLEE